MCNSTQKGNTHVPKPPRSSIHLTTLRAPCVLYHYSKVISHSPASIEPEIQHGAIGHPILHTEPADYSTTAPTDQPRETPSSIVGAFSDFFTHPTTVAVLPTTSNLSYSRTSTLRWTALIKSILTKRMSHYFILLLRQPKA